jgi:hypothetical protein
VELLEDLLKKPSAYSVVLGKAAQCSYPKDVYAHDNDITHAAHHNTTNATTARDAEDSAELTARHDLMVASILKTIAGASSALDNYRIDPEAAQRISFREALNLRNRIVIFASMRNITLQPDFATCGDKVS